MHPFALTVEALGDGWVAIKVDGSSYMWAGWSPTHGQQGGHLSLTLRKEEAEMLLSELLATIGPPSV